MQSFNDMYLDEKKEPTVKLTVTIRVTEREQEIMGMVSQLLKFPIDSVIADMMRLGMHSYLSGIKNAAKKADEPETIPPDVTIN